MNKIKEDMQLKEALKEAEAKKRGGYQCHFANIFVSDDYYIFTVPLFPDTQIPCPHSLVSLSANTPSSDMCYIHPEKIEDAKAKAAIKAQIEADKKARAEKAAREKALRDGQPLPESGSSTVPARAAAPAAAVAGKDFKETRLQIRMSTGGQPYTTTLSSDARKCVVGIGIFND